MTERPGKAASLVLANICSPSAVTPILYSLFPSMTQNPKHASCFSHHLHNFLVCLRKTAQQLCVLQSFAVTEMLISPCTVHLLLTSWWVSHACKWLYSSSLGHPGAVCHFTFLCVCFWLVDFFFYPTEEILAWDLCSFWVRGVGEQLRALVAFQVAEWLPLSFSDSQHFAGVSCAERSKSASFFFFPCLVSLSAFLPSARMKAMRWAKTLVLTEACGGQRNCCAGQICRKVELVCVFFWSKPIA